MIPIRRIAASFVVSAVALALTPAALAAQPKPGHLDEVLRQMDAASVRFQSAEANFRWDLYERVVKDTTTQTGTIYFKKQGSSTVMGAKITSPTVKDSSTFAVRQFRGSYDPGTNHLTTSRCHKETRRS